MCAACPAADAAAPVAALAAALCCADVPLPCAAPYVVPPEAFRPMPFVPAPPELPIGPVGPERGEPDVAPDAPPAGLGFCLLPAAVAASVLPRFFATIMETITGRPLPSGSPVRAGFSPTRHTRSSTFRPTRAMATTKISHGMMPAPLGTVLMAESSSFKNTTFISIITHMEPYIRTQPLKISSVLLLPPIPKARGAMIVKTASTT